MVLVRSPRPTVLTGPWGSTIDQVAWVKVTVTSRSPLLDAKAAVTGVPSSSPTMA